MKTVIIVQARATSARLPGKVLADLAGRPMLAQQLRRLQRCRRADDIVVATTVNRTDDPVKDVADAAGVRWYRGDEHDVLGRYLGAARASDAGLIVRITADCPLIDPVITDAVIERAAAAPPCDYASNVLRRTYPTGLDAEALHRDVLERTARLARSAAAREHVTWFIRDERPALFVSASVEDETDNSDLRWTVDTAADLAHARRLYEGLGLADRECPYQEVLSYARAMLAGDGGES
jgi:spore coat polysaccharide biosynthesis protein SpsF